MASKLPAELLHYTLAYFSSPAWEDKLTLGSCMRVNRLFYEGAVRNLVHSLVINWDTSLVAHHFIESILPLLHVRPTLVLAVKSLSIELDNRTVTSAPRVTLQDDPYFALATLIAQGGRLKEFIVYRKSEGSTFDSFLGLQEPIRQVIYQLRSHSSLEFLDLRNITSIPLDLIRGTSSQNNRLQALAPHFIRLGGSHHESTAEREKRGRAQHKIGSPQCTVTNHDLGDDDPSLDLPQLTTLVLDRLHDDGRTNGYSCPLAIMGTRGLERIHTLKISQYAAKPPVSTHFTSPAWGLARHFPNLETLQAKYSMSEEHSKTEFPTSFPLLPPGVFELRPRGSPSSGISAVDRLGHQKLRHLIITIGARYLQSVTIDPLRVMEYFQWYQLDDALSEELSFPCLESVTLRLTVNPTTLRDQASFGILTNTFPYKVEKLPSVPDLDKSIYSEVGEHRRLLGKFAKGVLPLTRKARPHVRLDIQLQCLDMPLD